MRRFPADSLVSRVSIAPHAPVAMSEDPMNPSHDPVREQRPAADQPHIFGDGEPGLASVIIPTYNRAHIVADTIRSVLEQTYRPLEVIVIDDGSSDDTRRIVEGFGTPVRYFHQPNAGVSAARNHGFRRARGEFIALLDSDDRWHPWKLARQVDVLRRHPEVGMVWTDMSAVNDKGEVIHRAYLRMFYGSYRFIRIEDICRRIDDSGAAPGPPENAAAAAPVYEGDIFSPMLLGNLIHTSTVLLRRDRLKLVGGFDESLRFSGEDYEFHLRTCYYGPVAFLAAPSTLYRIGAADQLTAPHLTIHIARNNLRTVVSWLA